VPKFDITLVGEANLDLLLYGLPEELPVERELLADRMAMVLGGSPAITAHNLAALGSRVGFITALSGDLFASMCFEDLSLAGVDLSRAVRLKGGAHTGISILTSSRHFHLSSYFLQSGLRKDVPRLLSWCKRAGLTTSLDPNDDPSGEWRDSLRHLLPHVDILMPNEREACRLTGLSDPEAAIDRLAEQVPLLIVKRGSKGAIARSGVDCWESPAVAVASVDAVGAGDSFNAGFLHSYLQGHSIERCLQLGNLAGAFSTTAIGGTGAFRDRATLRSFLAAHLEEPLSVE
jgi:sugar/nucleoside kinase (ribokinase family)